MRKMSGSLGHSRVVARSQLFCRVFLQFVKFSNIAEDTPSYHRRYDFFVSKFSSMCHSAHADPEIRAELRTAGLRGLQVRHGAAAARNSAAAAGWDAAAGGGGCQPEVSVALGGRGRGGWNPVNHRRTSIRPARGLVLPF